jgi:molybdenum cofactor synthesis domain-containing protein
MPKSKRPTVVIFSQGDEVITGATVDTNAAYLSQQCHQLGFDIIRHITVADDMAELVQLMRDIDGMADVCLCTGGLGPTQDDLTSEAYAQAFGLPLSFDEETYNMMSAYFEKLNVPMAEVNRKQAYLPEQSVRIDNYWGTAAGFVGAGNHCRFYFMPGVPYEMRNMMASFVIDDLKQTFHIEKTKLITLRIMGMGESSIQQIINELNIPDVVRVSFRAGLPENELKLTFPNGYPDKELRACIGAVQDALGSVIYAVDGLDTNVDSLADCVDQLMQKNEQSLLAVETLSQGLFAKQCNASWLKSSQVFPLSDNAIEAMQMVKEQVSEKTALMMAKKLAETSVASMVMVQLYQETGKNKSDIYTAVVDNASALSSTREVSGRTDRQQIVAAAAGLNLVRKTLLN